MLKTCLGVAFVILAFAYVSEQDYQIKSAEACEAKGRTWDGKGCVVTFRTERKVVCK